MNQPAPPTPARPGTVAPSDLSFGRFFLPGPTEVRPEVLAAQVEPMIGHRGPAIQDLMSEVQDGLKALFRTASPVLVSTSSATGLMEAGIRNGVRERVLCLVNGAFSQRFADIAEACGKEAEVDAVEWGRTHDPEGVAERLASGSYDAVTVVHSETSTGALQPLAELAEVVAEHDDTVLLVDSVTGLGGAPVETDGWGLDFVLTGSQKALALPPGLAFGVASDAMMARAATVPGRGMYFDLLAFRKQIDELQTPNTPALSLIYALRAQLGRIRGEGLEARWARHGAMAERCWRWAEETDAAGAPLRVLVEEGRRSPTVTCVALPDGVEGPAVVKAVRRRGWVIGTGYGRLKPRTIRIGHMGDHTVDELEALLAVLDDALREVAGP